MDQPQLEKAVRELLADRNRRERMGTAARAFVLGQQGATERTLDLLQELLKKNRATKHPLAA